MTTQDATAATPTPARAGRREWTGLTVLALACVVVTMDLTVPLLAVPSLAKGLGPSATEVLWDHRHLRVPDGGLTHRDGRAR